MALDQSSFSGLLGATEATAGRSPTGEPSAQALVSAKLTELLVSNALNSMLVKGESGIGSPLARDVWSGMLASAIAGSVSERLGALVAVDSAADSIGEGTSAP